MRASRESNARGAARPRSQGERGRPRRRIALVEAFRIPVLLLAPCLLALAVWAWCLWALIKTFLH